MIFKRIALVVIDGFGVGAQPDSSRYGDNGANTLAHTLDGAKRGYKLDNLVDLGLLNAAGLPGAIDDPLACYGKMREISAGKDTTAGHWELAGLPVTKPFPTYPNGFPAELIKAFEDETGLKTIGNKPASGTAIIEELGEEHLLTGKLIIYTSSDSVFQIAAHESIMPPTELWHICRIARRLLTGEHSVGRVIARPFAGELGSFVRTDNRRDFSLDPIGETLLDVVKSEGLNTVGIGKIEDIFNHRGLTSSVHPSGNAACIDALCDTLKNPRFNGLAFVNLIDTDMLYGHRRDPEGYLGALELIDKRLQEIMRYMGDDSLLFITSDHGCDPTYTGTDHTREHVPLLVWGLGINEGVDLGVRGSFADVSATILDCFGIKKRLAGKSFFDRLTL